MNKELKDLTVCVIDHGLFVPMAERLAREGGFGRVFYWLPNMASFPTPHLSKIGTGLDNVERVTEFFDIIDQCDLFIFLDVGFGDLQDYLRGIGKLVWGSGKGDAMELARWTAKEIMQEVGLPVSHSVLIKGLDNLRAYLKSNDNVWVKISLYRGIGETFKSENYQLVKIRLDMIEHDLGPLSAEQEFICESEIKTDVEVGFDGYCIDGKFPNMASGGIELKDQAFIGAVFPYEQLHKSIKEVNAKMAPVFAQYRYRGFFSSEIRIARDGTAYFIDSTNRVPSPPGEIFQEMFTNLPEIMLEGARGNCIEPVAKSKCAAEIMLCSDFAPKEFLAVEYPKSIAQNVKLYNSLRRNGIDYIVPTEGALEQVGAVTGFGDTFQEAAEKAMENAKLVKGDRISVKDGIVEELMKALRDSADKGVTFGDSKIP